jgi:hypothetical protein
MSYTFTFNVHVGSDTRTITQDELGEYAQWVGLDRVAPDRYSWLFVLDLLLNEQVNGVDPFGVVDEIKALEAGESRLGTKPASEFTHEPLRGLWHKHYFSAHFVGKNIQNHFAGRRLDRFIRKIFDPAKSPIVTREMIEEFAHGFAHEPLEHRAEAERLTGEWIIFAKHEEQNYYLCLATHTSGDEAIFARIASACFRQFPFLAVEP